MTNSYSHLNETLLDLCYHDDLDTIQTFIINNYEQVKKEINFNYSTTRGANPDTNLLNMICDRGELKILDFFLTHPDFKQKINIHETAKDGFNMLHCSCYSGHLDIVKYLLTSPKLKEHLQINDTIISSNKNALIIAGFAGHLDIVKYLLTSPELKEHADIHSQLNDGWNVLQYCCFNGDLEIVKYLLTSPELKEHANVKHQSKLNENILMTAGAYGYLDIVKFLLDNFRSSFNFKDTDDQGNNLLTIVAREGKLDVFKYLIENYPETKKLIYKTNHKKLNLFVECALSNRSNIIEYLMIEQDFSVDDNTFYQMEKYNCDKIITFIQQLNLYKKMNNSLATNTSIRKKKI